MKNRLTSFFTKYDLLSTAQYGFLKGKSTGDALIELLEYVYMCLNEKEFLIGVSVDLCKAFDTLQHPLLLEKLERYGVRGVGLEWIRSYLSGRRQYVFINGVNSSVRHLNIGVPQGSILGPLLFLIYINDLPDMSNQLKPILFADDTTFLLSDRSFSNLIPKLNSELNLVYDWTIYNRLSVNSNKTSCMLFSNRHCDVRNDIIRMGPGP